MYHKNWLILFTTLFYLTAVQSEVNSGEDVSDSARYVIEGRVFPSSQHLTQTGVRSIDSDVPQSNWQANTRILVNGGEYLGFVRKDGTFYVNNVPSGSYLIDILHPEYTFEPVRVEINSKGKFRARKVNFIQSTVVQVPYPLKIKALGKTRYFQVREQWRITDVLFNPMMIMLILPTVLIMILPKMMNDPETKKEMEQIQNLTKFEMPEMGDYVSNYLAGNGGQSSSEKTKKAIKNKKRQ